MHMFLTEHLKVITTLEKKFNELTTKGEFDAAYGVSLAIIDELRRTATGVEQSITESLRVGMVRRAQDSVAKVRA